MVNSPYGMTGSCILDLRFLQKLEVLEIPSPNYGMCTLQFGRLGIISPPLLFDLFSHSVSSFLF